MDSPRQVVQTDEKLFLNLEFFFELTSFFSSNNSGVGY